jgi:hypothetical protein
MHTVNARVVPASTGIPAGLREAGLPHARAYCDLRARKAHRANGIEMPLYDLPCPTPTGIP